MENTGRTSSCLSISEKKTHKPGGCVGIFFQLFDWNRRLAKNKLFSRKLLPPARSKQVASKFNGGDKMLASKNHLIADENRGGFPNVKKNGSHCTDLRHKNETRVPGLVARLMGLEAMPVTSRDRPKKIGCSNPCDNVEKKTVEDMNLDKARPLKLKKTRNAEEGKVMRRIGAEALQYKSVVSRSRKPPPTPKLPSSTKSPRLPSGRNVSRASRLIDVASKILEPGLQMSNRAKSAITLPNSLHCSLNQDISREIGVLPLEGYHFSKSLVGQASCKTCNDLQNVEEYPSAIPPLGSTHGNASFQGSGRSETITPDLPLEQDRAEFRPTICDRPKTFASIHNESKGCMISHGDSIADKVPRKVTTNESSIVKHRSQSRDHMISVRDRMSSTSRSNIPPSRRTTSPANAVTGTKNFIALNRSLNGCSRGNSKYGLERKSFNGGEDFSSQSGTSPRKRRTAHLSAQIESKPSVDSSAAKQRPPLCDNLSGTSSRLKRKALPKKQLCASNRLAGHRNAADRVCKRDNDIVSFIFDSPVRQKTTVATEIESMENERNTSSRKPSLFGGDALDILEQKLKELTSQEDDESALKKPASVIIQELIAAVESARKDSSEVSAVDVDVTFYNDSKEERLTKISKGRDQLSPGSVLEASFSSSSMDESSGCIMPAESVDCSIDQSHQSELDADILDSATSFSEWNVWSERLTDVFNAISSILQIYSLTGLKLARAKEVMLNTEILFGRDENKLLILPLFIDELETFTCEMWTNFSDVDSKEVNHLRVFLFDCLIECLDSKHSELYYGGSNGWIRTSRAQNARELIRDVEKEIKKWVRFVGMMTDEIIEWEMNHSLGKWSDFSIEELENGAEIDGYILQVLLEEIVTELWI